MDRVLYLGGFELPDRNAAAQRVVAVAKTMRELGCQVEFVGVTRNPNEAGLQQSVDGFRYTSVKYPANYKEWFFQITKFIPQAVIDEKKPDIVVLYNFPAVAQKRITDYCHERGIKVLVDLTEWYVTEGNNPRDLIKKWDTRKRMTDYNFRVEGVIAISRYLYDYYKDKVKTVYIPATVDLNDGKWNRSKKVEIHHPIRLVYAGSPGSGQKDKLDVLVKAVTGKTGFELNVFGLTKEQFQENFGGEVKSENILFHGRVLHQEAIKMVCDSDFDVIIREDNLVTRAGFPVKFVEAYSCGIPVIATPSSNIKDYLKDGTNGFVVDAGHSLELVLDRIAGMSDSELISIKEQARELTDFDYRNYVNEIRDILS